MGIDKKLLSFYLDDYAIDAAESDKLFMTMDPKNLGKLNKAQFIAEYAKYEKVVLAEPGKADKGKTTMVKGAAPAEPGKSEVAAKPAAAAAEADKGSCCIIL